MAGRMPLCLPSAKTAADVAGAEHGVTGVELAAATLSIANAAMVRAIKVISVERGHDPREFSLLSFGGAGGLHACELAEELGIRTVVVPRMPVRRVTRAGMPARVLTWPLPASTRMRPAGCCCR